MPSHSLQSYVSTATEACGRWGVKFQVPTDADDARAATIIKANLLRAGNIAAASETAPFYCDDNSWIHNGIFGVTLARIAEEQVIATNPTAQSTDEWGIMARVSSGDYVFDIPIALYLDEDSSRNILAVIAGKEAAFVDIEELSVLIEGSVEIVFHADNWAALRDMQRRMSLPMVDAMAFRRPAAWDITRARLSELPPEPLPAFSEEAFYARYARSVRYDAPLMESNRLLVGKLAAMDVPVGSAKWGEWFPAVTDLLMSIGDPAPMDGMTVLINFVVEEPLAVQPESYLDPEHPDHKPYRSWDVVGFHNLAVGFGLHPLTAVALYDLVVENADAFYDLPEREDRRFRAVGASIVHDTMLSMTRASLNGRTDVYESMVEGQEESLSRMQEASSLAAPASEEPITF